MIELKRFKVRLVLPVLEKTVNGLYWISVNRIGRGPGNFSDTREALVWSLGFIVPGDVALNEFSSGKCAGVEIS